MDKREVQPNTGQSIGAVMSSVIAAILGVQSNKKREEDFTQGKASHYIIAGILATVLFVLSLWGIVQLVMHFAGM